MTEPLRILILEDNPDDAAFIKFELEENELVFTSKVVANEKDFVLALDEFVPDLILSDYDLPTYNGAMALAKSTKKCPEVPFILVTGAVSEDRAIEILTQGAKDYVLKSRLEQKLVPAIRRVLAEAEERKARKRAELRLREAHRTLKQKVKARTVKLEAEIAVRKRIEESLRRRNDVMAGFNRILETALSNQTEEEFCCACLEVIESITGSKISFIGEIGSDGFLHDLAISSPGWNAWALYDSAGHLISPGNFPVSGIYGRVISDGKSLIINNPASYPDGIGLPKGHPSLNSFLGVPLMRKGKPIGILALGNREGGYNSEDQKMIESLAPAVVEILYRKRAEKALRESEQLLQDIINGSTSPISLKDVSGKFITINLSFERMYGISREEIKGKTDYDIAPREAADCWRANDQRVIESGKAIQIEEVADLQNSYHIFLANKFPLVDAEGYVYGVGAISHDITKRKYAEKALAEKTQELEYANKELESFSYSISHDLRAPLRAIDGFSRIILKKQGVNFDEDTLNKFNVIRHNTEKMGQLIDGLLELSRLGRRSMSMSLIDMNNLIKEVWEEIEIINPDRKLSIEIKPAPQSFGDEQLIRQVYSNLLANAVKFTKNRDIALLEAGGSIDDVKENIYYVKDNGAGFDMTYYDKLFGVFQRLHSSEEFEGTGIGLATIQRIISKHGGRVWAEGRVNEGATFYFSLPIANNI